MFTFTNNSGNQISENVDLRMIFDARWQESPVPQWMGLHSRVGIPFYRLTTMRRSTEYRVAAEAYVQEVGGHPGESNLRRIGVMPAERVTRTDTVRTAPLPTTGCVATERPATTRTVRVAGSDEALTTRFGVEIEFLSPVEKDVIAQAVSEAGVPCRDEGYNHTLRTWWKIVHDGSVEGAIDGATAKGLEIVSPPLTVEDGGLAQVKTVCETLESLGCKINKTCGLHVHVEAAGLKTRQLRNVCVAWIKNEHVITSLCPPSRRVNTHCKTLLRKRGIERRND